MTAATAEAVSQSQPTMPPSMLTAPINEDTIPGLAPVDAPTTDAMETETMDIELDARAQIAQAIEAAEADDAFGEEIKVGFEKLRAMNHTELRQVITRRVELLETVLRGRDERRAAIDTARLASRMLDLRRERALRIQKRVNFGSALAAVASTMLIVAVMV
jgi:hypothetical protein